MERVTLMGLTIVRTKEPKHRKRVSRIGKFHVLEKTNASILRLDNGLRLVLPSPLPSPAHFYRVPCGLRPRG